MRYFEEYACGCTSNFYYKKNLLGYCSTHGASTKYVYKRDGTPADTVTKERTLELARVLKNKDT